MAIEWTKESIEKYDIGSIKSLMLNVKVKGRHDIADLCQEVIEEKTRIEPKSQRKARIPNNPIKAMEQALCEKLLEVAEEMLEKYDLSEQTARELSRGTKRFIPHKLLSSSNQGIKTGAHQTKDKRVVFDRYISYRLGDYAYSLFCIMFDENDMNSVKFHVLGDPVHLDKFKSINELRPYFQPGEAKGANKGGEEFTSFDEAAERYKWLMSKIAPPLGKP